METLSTLPEFLARVYADHVERPRGLARQALAAALHRLHVELLALGDDFSVGVLEDLVAAAAEAAPLVELHPPAELALQLASTLHHDGYLEADQAEALVIAVHRYPLEVSCSNSP